jgi:TRAP-type mannitol/chloroaromatic compound transport system permease small subunit
MKIFFSIVSKIASFTLIVLVGVIIFDIANRYFLSNGSIALQEIEWHLFDLIMLLSISLTLREDGHVRVDILYSNFSEKRKNFIDIFSHIFFIIPFSVLIIWSSISFVEMSFLQNEVSSNPRGLNYRFLVKSLIIIGFFLLILQSISSIFSILKSKNRD